MGTQKKLIRDSGMPFFSSHAGAVFFLLLAFPLSTVFADPGGCAWDAAATTKCTNKYTFCTLGGSTQSGCDAQNTKAGFTGSSGCALRNTGIGATQLCSAFTQTEYDTNKNCQTASPCSGSCSASSITTLCQSTVLNAAQRNSIMCSSTAAQNSREACMNAASGADTNFHGGLRTSSILIGALTLAVTMEMVF